jgi:hypothetical protein
MKNVYLSAILLLACALVAPAAPVPGAPPAGAPRWEYCEVHARIGVGVNVIIRPAGGAQPANPVAVPAAAMRLVTAEEEIEGSSWEDLATKVKAEDAKTSAGKFSHKVRVFNKLGADGWELVEYHRDNSSISDVWVFKRKTGK